MRSTYNAEVQNQGNRIVQIPNTFAGFNLVSDGAAAAGAYMAANVQIVAGATVAVVTHLVGIQLGLPVVEAFRATITIAIGPAPETTIMTLEVGTNLFPVVEWNYPIIIFEKGIALIGQPRLSFNIRKDTAASAAGFNNCHLILRNGVGS
jgi:hypothetical protein